VRHSGRASLGCGQLSVRREAANRVTIDYWYKRQCGAVGVDSSSGGVCGVLWTQLDGVMMTTSGYSGGREAAPTYQTVSAGITGHAEALQVILKGRTRCRPVS
jgi:hypothetical protein